MPAGHSSGRPAFFFTIVKTLQRSGRGSRSGVENSLEGGLAGFEDLESAAPVGVARKFQEDPVASRKVLGWLGYSREIFRRRKFLPHRDRKRSKRCRLRRAPPTKAYSKQSLSPCFDPGRKRSGLSLGPFFFLP